MDILDKLKILDQSHLRTIWEQLSSKEKESLDTQIQSIDPQILKEQQLLLKSQPIERVFVPYNDFSSAGNTHDKMEGQKAIAHGLMGCLILAGGQGTRLGHDGPKGTFLINGKSLFQIFAEQIADSNLPLAIMTSHENDAATRAFWKQHNNFGLKNVSFFKQTDLPLLNDEGKLFLESRSRLAMGPDGNGSVFTHFVNSGIWDAWHKQGVAAINIILVDNVLADPFDAELLGYHLRKKAEVTIKCTKRRDAEEKVGVLVKENNRVAVIEYSELGSKRAENYCANLSLFCVAMEFAKKLSQQQFPLHLAHKAASYYENGEIKHPPSPNAWKSERFIFDMLPFADKVEALLYPRDQCFAPLKNKTGSDSPATVQEALYKKSQMR